MQNDFYKRFNIPINLSKAQGHFMNRIKNIIHLLIDEMYRSFFPDFFLEGKKRRLLVFVANKIGKKFDSIQDFEESIDREENFLEHLHLVEAFYACIDEDRQSQLSELVEDAISESVFDLGTIWSNGKFLKKGAPILDKRLVNESLGILKGKSYENVLDPFEKGLKCLLQSQKEPGSLVNATTNVYEALEALAKIVCGNDRDLSGNRQLFIAKINTPEFYKKVLKEYIEYACEFRHAVKEGEKRRIPSEREVEAFVYLTAIFIRLALWDKSHSEVPA